MRRQSRPFIVEVRQKRGSQRRNGSIWGDIDFSAALAEASTELPEPASSNHEHIDSNIVARDAEGLQHRILGKQMADPEQGQSTGAATERAVKIDASDAKKKPRRSRKAKAQPNAPARTNGEPVSNANGTAAATARGARKVYSEKERAQILAQIDKLIGGGSTRKSAVKQAGISDQTFYLWKKAAVAAPESDELKDLVALEEENKRLKSLLAERLRKENAELKKKLGLH